MNNNNIGYLLILLLIILVFLLLYRQPNVEYFEDNTTYTAVIIEPRKHKALQFVLKNFLENLDINWNIIIFHGNLNKEYIENIIDTDLYIKNVYH